MKNRILSFCRNSICTKGLRQRNGQQRLVMKVLCMVRYRFFLALGFTFAVHFIHHRKPPPLGVVVHFLDRF